MTRKQENIVFIVSSIIIWSLMMAIILSVPDNLSEVQTILFCFGPLVIIGLAYNCGRMGMKRELQETKEH